MHPGRSISVIDPMCASRAAYNSTIKSAPARRHDKISSHFFLSKTRRDDLHLSHRNPGFGIQAPPTSGNHDFPQACD